MTSSKWKARSMRRSNASARHGTDSRPARFKRKEAMIHLSVSIILLAAMALQPGAVSAQGYPNRSIRVIVPASPGDSCDILTRLIGHKVGERLGQQFAADNRPGASGMLGLQLIAQASPDGYTIGCGQGGNMVIVPIAYQK